MAEVVSTFENLLVQEAERGIIDLEADWNPVQDAQVPTLSIDDDNSIVEVQAAHVVLSPFSRPNGWHLKLPNRSMVNALLTRAREQHIRMAWKLVQIEEYDYISSKQRDDGKEQDYARANFGSTIVDDSMVRFENCPGGLTDEYLRYLLSRYDLAPQGNTVIRWRGRTSDGKEAPLTFVVRFASAAWARACVREFQSMKIDDKLVKLVAYPKQLLYKEEKDETAATTAN
jgi:hypothetical protein